MAIEAATISFDIADMLGADFDPRRTKVWVTTNVPDDTIVDTVGNKIRLGSGNVTLNADGTGSLTVWVPSPGSNPASWQTTIHVDYPDRNERGGRGRRDFGPFTITTSNDLAVMVAEQEVPPTYVSQVTAQLDAKVTEASGYADDAAASAAQAKSVAEIDTSDALMASVASDPASEFAQVQSATIAGAAEDGTPLRQALDVKFARLQGPLGGWKAKLANDPANAKMVVLGDSTSDATTGAYVMYARLLALHSQQGEPLHGLASSDYFTDGVGNGTTTFTSATANFTAADVGRVIHGATFLTSTVITAVTNSTTVTLSLAVPSGTGLRFWVGRHIVNGGNNGMPLSTWLDSPAYASPYNQNEFLAETDVDLVVASWLINDVRTGLLGTTVDTIVAAGFARLKTFVDLVRAQKPNADILLRMPNSLTTTNTGGSNYVTNGATVNPAGLAQIYSTALRRIYLRFVGLYPNVDVLDTQGEVFGTQSQSSSPYMADQLHPSLFTRRDLLNLVPVGGGYAALSDAIAARIGFKRNAFPDSAAQMQREFLIDRAPAAGQVWLVSRDPNVSAVQVPVYKTDTLVINGLDASQALTGATFFKNSGSVALQISGLGATDFTPYIGKTATIRGDHAGPTTGDRRNVTVDIPSVAAGGYATVDLTVTGVRFSALDEPTGIIAQPGANLLGSGLVMLGAYVRATDSVRVVVHNPTASAADPASESWTFWIVR